MIYLRDVVHQMGQTDSNGRPAKFDVETRTFNRYAKTGGQYKIYEDAELVMYQKRSKIDREIAMLKSTEKKERKNPHHFANKTKNIRLASGKIRKINLLFIIKFNGKKVIY